MRFPYFAPSPFLPLFSFPWLFLRKSERVYLSTVCYLLSFRGFRRLGRAIGHLQASLAMQKNKTLSAQTACILASMFSKRGNRTKAGRADLRRAVGMYVRGTSLCGTCILSCFRYLCSGPAQHVVMACYIRHHWHGPLQHSGPSYEWYLMWVYFVVWVSRIMSYYGI